jgi:hypothetical protein
MADTLELLLRDYVTELVLLLEEARMNATHTDSFADGRRFGLYEALSLTIDVARQFGISMEAVGHANLDPDSFLK